MTDRKEGGAHHGYGIYRAAFEILESINKLPPSELVSSHEGDGGPELLAATGDASVYSENSGTLTSTIAMLEGEHELN